MEITITKGAVIVQNYPIDVQPDPALFPSDHQITLNAKTGHLICLAPQSTSAGAGMQLIEVPKSRLEAIMDQIPEFLNEAIDVAAGRVITSVMPDYKQRNATATAAEVVLGGAQVLAGLMGKILSGEQIADEEKARLRESAIGMAEVAKGLGPYKAWVDKVRNYSNKLKEEVDNWEDEGGADLVFGYMGNLRDGWPVLVTESQPEEG